MADYKTYQQEYWKKNRDRLLEKRKERYRKDAEYRRKMKERALESKKRFKELENEDLLSGGIVKRGPKSSKVHRLELPGNRSYNVTMLTIGQLSKALGRVPQTIRSWEEKGYIPRAIYRDSNDNRLYTEFQVKKLQEFLFRARDVDGATKIRYNIGITIFPKLAHKLWEEYPYGIDPSKEEESDGEENSD
jgi:hypothetical protein